MSPRKPNGRTYRRLACNIRTPLAIALEERATTTSLTKTDIVSLALDRLLYRDDQIYAALDNLAADVADLHARHDTATANTARLEALLLKSLEYAVASWFASGEILREPLTSEQLKTVLTRIAKEADDKARTIYETLL